MWHGNIVLKPQNRRHARTGSYPKRCLCGIDHDRTDDPYFYRLARKELIAGQQAGIESAAGPELDGDQLVVSEEHDVVHAIVTFL